MIDVLRRESSDGCSTMQMYLMLLNCTTGMIQIIHFMFCTFFSQSHAYTNIHIASHWLRIPSRNLRWFMPLRIRPSAPPPLASTLSSPRLVILNHAGVSSHYFVSSLHRPFPLSTRLPLLHSQYFSFFILSWHLYQAIKEQERQQLPVCFPVSAPTSLQFMKGKKVSSHLELCLWCSKYT